MKKSLVQSFLVGFMSTLLFVGVSSVNAAGSVTGQINEALAKKNLADVQVLLKKGSGNVDEVIRALLKTTQNTMGSDPAFSNKMMAMAGEYAPQITPPSVPVICADLRRLVESMTPEQAGTPLYATIVQASQDFSNAPVVVASGRPNQCDNAFLQIDALLAQTPGMRGPSLPPVTIRPGVPKEPPPTEKPSAD
ncbi:MAG: hypothetical protein WC612_00890 [Bdellovibrionales bacterium]